MDDETLVEECVSGNAKAQRLLFDRFSPRMMGAILRYISDRERAEDVLQDGFIKVFNNIHKFENNGSLEGWIRRIMINTALDQIRKDKKRQRDVEIDSMDYFELKQNSKSEGILEAESLLELVQSLPDGYRTVFNLLAIEGYSHKEIAEELNISENTSKSQYSRARSALQELLNKYKIER